MFAYSHTEYRALLKDRLSDVKKNKAGLTLKSIAKKIPIQYTYLSKALNSDSVHLNEDHLFKFGKILGLQKGELEYLLLLRNKEVSQDSERKKHLENQLAEIRQTQKLKAKVQIAKSDPAAEAEIAYLLEPLCPIIHMALELPEVAKNPRGLCTRLQISMSQLKSILKIMDTAGFIQLDDDGLTVLAVRETRFHFSRSHPLMRVHQALLKSQLITKIHNVEEKNKTSFLATFTMNEAGFKKANAAFDTFIKTLEEISEQSKKDGVYQLCFDLFQLL